LRALYTAQGHTRSDAAGADPTAGNLRPKTMAETMEDILLQEDALASDEPPPESPEVGEGSKLGITVAQPETGALRPTIMLGIGSFGRRALLELRCRLVDRFGDLEKTPLFRFVYVDSDPESVQAAVRGAPEVAFGRGEVHHLPLQPVGQYRRRMLDQLSEWLPREKLYTVPRSLQTQGSRALGRLAFVDNHNRFLARVRREVQKATQP